jgi:hypothetical protein
VKKPLAPFSKKLEYLLSNNQKPRNNIFVFIGVNAFQKAKAFETSQFVLALPYGDDPEIYRWSVRGCEPLVFDTGGIYVNANLIRKFAYILLESGAVVVRIMLLDGRMVIYRREDNNARNK